MKDDQKRSFNISIPTAYPSLLPHAVLPFIPSPALCAVAPRVSPPQRTGAATLLDHLAVVGGTTDAVVAGGIKTQRAAAALLDCAACVATTRGNAVAP